ncbi:MAG: hypothetical protein IPJ88_00650 [Myxococcales bacterium]|nr:MAG: hypothetical protein IPJ88_00650 [Myxococcales bacterium]
MARAKELDTDPRRPRIDKTLYEIYQPGSTLKPMVAIAGLMEHVVKDHPRVTCGGYYELGRDRKRCTQVHGDVDLRAALVQSCNVYFYRLAETLGLDRVYKYFTDFGFGQKTGIGINTEAAGFIPTRQWYVDHYKTPFRIGYTLNEAIGQGNTRVTLLQLAMAYAALANGGVIYAPKLVNGVRSHDKEVVERGFPAKIKKTLGIPQEYLEEVRKGMIGVVNDSKGTAFDARIPDGVLIAGKTGTAQVSQQAESTSIAFPNFQLNRDHAWFAGFAPAIQPELAIVVLVEHGGGGGKYAAPIAINALTEYFRQR